MYIEPNSTIKILKNVPLDNTYKHSLYFASLSAQNTYFTGKAKYTLAKQSYQRVVKGKMRVQLCADDIYDCNYMMFNNTNFGSKWFYAFITGIEYVNNVTSEITFEIDSLQTYFFDTELLACYIEREHSATDKIGDNLVPEPFGNPEQYVITKYFKHWGTWKLAIQFVPKNIVAQAFSGTMMYSDYQIRPLTNTYDLDENNLAQINSDLALALAAYDMTNCFMYPSAFDDSTQWSADGTIAYDDLNTNNITRPSGFLDYSSDTANPTVYTPKNKKLLTSPYTELKVTTSEGQSFNYKWELTREGYLTFRLYFNKANQPSCELRPNNYQRDTAQRLTGVSILDFPKVSVSGVTGLRPENLNAFASLLAMTKLPTPTEDVQIPTMAHSAQSAVSGMFSGDTRRVGTSGSNMDLKYKQFGFQFYVMGIKAQDAEVIDNYFSMFGYATKKIKVPNRNVRPHWCYTKTRDCVVKANAPADDVRKICQIYDNGITFWKNPSEVGNYSLDNSVQ